MILFGYDPVAGKAIIDLPTMVFPLEVAMEKLFLKYYGDSGIGVATLDRDGVVLEFFPIEGEPAFIHFNQEGAFRWSVSFNHPGTNGPG